MRYRVFAKLLATASLVAATHAAVAQSLKTGPNDTLETQGLSVIVDQNQFSPIFFDEKNAGIQMILHGDRIATDGAVRLEPDARAMGSGARLYRAARAEPSPTSWWCALPIKMSDLSYRVKVTAEGEGFRIAVDLDQPLPAKLAGKAGFNLDFLPTAYFGKTYLMDAAPGLFPRHPIGPMAKDGSGDPLPLATGGKSITLVARRPDDARDHHLG